MSEVQASRLEEITAQLGLDYIDWKDSEALKNGGKEIFFHLADLELAKQEPAEKPVDTWPVGDEDEGALLARIERFNPGWKLDEFRARLIDGEPYYETILVEDITLKPFTYVNKSDGKVYARTVSSGSVMLDDEYLKADNPDLYDEISFKLPWGERVTKPLKLLEADKLAAVSKYIYKGKPSVKLAAPRKAKPEELADA